MSEPIFRAWDKKNKRWLIEIDFVIDSDGDIHLLKNIDGYYTLTQVAAVLCRSTGLKDRNGKMIFEFDIIKTDHHTPENYKIVFVDGAFCANRIKEELDLYCLDMNHFYPSIGCQIEVVGNVLENPELLEQKQNG